MYYGICLIRSDKLLVASKYILAVVTTNTILVDIGEGITTDIFF